MDSSARRDTTEYRLPNGRIVAIDADVARHAAVIDFSLASGRIVQAVRADIPVPTYRVRRALCDATRKESRS